MADTCKLLLASRMGSAQAKTSHQLTAVPIQLHVGGPKKTPEIQGTSVYSTDYFCVLHARLKQKETPLFVSNWCMLLRRTMDRPFNTSQNFIQNAT